MEQALNSEIKRQIEDTIRQAMENVRPVSSRNRDWTIAIIEALTRLGQELRYQVRGALPRTNSSGWDWEWLWDLCWMSEGPEHKILGFPLAVESEWDPHLE